MNILIVTEKRTFTRHIAPFAQKTWPGAQITFVQAVPYANIKMRFPRGLKLSQFPLIATPVFQLLHWDAWFSPPLSLALDGTLVPTEMSRELFTNADLIVSACDPGQTGAGAFDVLMRLVFGDDRAGNCPNLRCFSLDDASLEEAFSALAPFRSSAAPAISYGQAKRYFDWNWNANALAVFGAAAREVGVARDAPPLSKCALQLLYKLRDGKPVRDGALIHRMQEWVGTGRYTKENGKWRVGLGGAASRMQICENLLAAGLLATVKLGAHSAYVVTDLGQQLLARLHPGCEDADLPFRLNAWCEQGLDTSKPAIDRYIRTVFGKQLRYLPSKTT